MIVELDHVFLCCSLGAPEATALIESGVLEGSSNTHPGQGTANRRFVFRNLYIELLWVRDPIEAQSPLVRPTQLWDRWQRRGAGACPFGLVLRPGTSADARAPFATWSYKPPYLPAELSIEVASQIKSTEPLVFYLPFARGRNFSEVEPTAHAAQIDEIVGARLSLPEASELSPPLQALVAANTVRVLQAPDFLLELTFRGQRANPLDLRPTLPLVFVPQDTGG
jgi:hypothetical protein